MAITFCNRSMVVLRLRIQSVVHLHRLQSRRYAGLCYPNVPRKHLLLLFVPSYTQCIPLNRARGIQH
jgi:hypothetical protein